MATGGIVSGVAGDDRGMHALPYTPFSIITHFCLLIPAILKDNNTRLRFLGVSALGHGSLLKGSSEL